MLPHSLLASIRHIDLYVRIHFHIVRYHLLAIAQYLRYTKFYANYIKCQQFINEGSVILLYLHSPIILYFKSPFHMYFMSQSMHLHILIYTASIARRFSFIMLTLSFLNTIFVSCSCVAQNVAARCCEVKVSTHC